MTAPTEPGVPGRDPRPKGSHAHRNALKRIVVATDGSRSSAEAVGVAVELAFEHDAHLRVVHVVPWVDVVAPADLSEDGIEILHEPTERELQILADATATAARHGVSATSDLLRGAAAQEIVAYGEATDADLIVVGSSRRRGLVGLLLGSVSLRVLRRSRLPVLVVRVGSR